MGPKPANHKIEADSASRHSAGAFSCRSAAHQIRRSEIEPLDCLFSGAVEAHNPEIVA